jgi:heme oxygenase
MSDQVKQQVYKVMSATSLEEAKKAVVIANDNFDINETIFAHMLTFLMEKMPESEYVSFCNSL